MPERAGVVPKDHRCEGNSGRAVDEDRAAALGGEPDPSQRSPPLAELVAERSGGSAKGLDNRGGILLAASGLIHIERQPLVGLREQASAPRFKRSGLQSGRADVDAEIHFS